MLKILSRIGCVIAVISSACVFPSCEGGVSGKDRRADTVAKAESVKEDSAETPVSRKASGVADICADGYINGHGYVDLGLPSGTKWATMNVGATAAEECGIYIAWGEIKPKTIYAGENSKTLGDNSYNRDISGEKDADVATAMWGGQWSMPTESQMKELVANCTMEWSELNGVKGLKVTGRKTGRWIFLPAAGTAGSVGNANFVGVLGRYWSGSPYADNSFSAYNLYFKKDRISVDWDLRRYGNSVRPVSKQ